MMKKPTRRILEENLDFIIELIQRGLLFKDIHERLTKDKGLEIGSYGNFLQVMKTKPYLWDKVEIALNERRLFRKMKSKSKKELIHLEKLP